MDIDALFDLLLTGGFDGYCLFELLEVGYDMVLLNGHWMLVDDNNQRRIW